MKDILNRGAERRRPDATRSDDWRDEELESRQGTDDRDADFLADRNVEFDDDLVDDFGDDRDVEFGDDRDVDFQIDRDRPDIRAADRAGIGAGAHVAGRGMEAANGALFASDDAQRFRLRWTEIQTNFVDEPRRAVEEADDLVSEMSERITSLFTQNREELERQWSAGDEVSTEQLRRTLQSYRSFFERLLSL